MPISQLLFAGRSNFDSCSNLLVRSLKQVIHYQTAMLVDELNSDKQRNSFRLVILGMCFFSVCYISAVPCLILLTGL
jgi:hypothetical protein